MRGGVSRCRRRPIAIPGGTSGATWSRMTIGKVVPAPLAAKSVDLLSALCSSDLCSEVVQLELLWGIELISWLLPFSRDLA